MYTALLPFLTFLLASFHCLKLPVLIVPEINMVVRFNSDHLELGRSGKGNMLMTSGMSPVFN